MICVTTASSLVQMSHTKGCFAKKRSIAAMFAASTLAIPLAALPAQAAPDGDNVVISEVYTRGGSGDGVYRDFVELYNPTDAPIDLNGMSLQYFAEKRTTSTGANVLEGSIAPGGYWLVLGASGTHTTELNVDQTGTMNMSGNSGSIMLFNSTATQTIAEGDQTSNDLVVDAFGWGSSVNYEGKAYSGGTSGSLSYHRDAEGTDTDNNQNDFTVAEATPMNSSGSALGEDPDRTRPIRPRMSPPRPHPVRLLRLRRSRARVPRPR